MSYLNSKNGVYTKEVKNITLDIGLMDRAHRAGLNVSAFCNDMLVEFLPIFEEFKERDAP